MAKKDRPGAAKAQKPSRSKNAPAAGELQAAPPRPPEPLNNHVTVHIISVPPAQSAQPAQPAPLGQAPQGMAPAGSAPALQGLPAAPAAAPAGPAPSQRNPALPGPGSTPAPPLNLPTAPATANAAMPQRPVTPGAGSAALDPLAPTPVHKSAKNLSPMEQMLWAARLQKAKDGVANQMKVTVINGKLVRRYTAIDHDDGLFEIETDKGFYVAVLSKTGEFSIYWRHDRKAY
ncbi:MAG TPA: hypothetical protein VL860_12180 [Planctomycetota bacterium]|nr:hypothetical protein [Planctomycetota bacterium]